MLDVFDILSGLKSDKWTKFAKKQNCQYDLGMETSFTEIAYPLAFREKDTQVLGEHLKLRHSVELVGMKRVGISNFLRYFLYKKGIVEKYIDEREYHFFVTVDLNDLVEIEIFPFWILTFKRLVDRVSVLPINESVKNEIATLFLDAIQSRDLFLTVDALRKSLILICENNIFPTFFLLRFDRIGTVVNKQFYANLVGMREATGHRLAYVFTSFRSLSEIAPAVFDRKMLSEFSHQVHVKPALRADFKIILESLAAKYKLLLTANLENELWELCGGHIQYLNLAAIVLSKKQKEAEGKMLDVLTADERIKYMAEELWESLATGEQEVLLKVIGREKVTSEDKTLAKYLWDTGIVLANDQIFGKLFENSLKSHGNGNNNEEKVDFTKKEQLLYNFLLANKGEVCEREKIIEAVWSEVEDLGVSDWTIDRLVARLRTKLKKQGSEYQVVTVKTRGYKLTQ